MPITVNGRRGNILVQSSPGGQLVDLQSEVEGILQPANIAPIDSSVSGWDTTAVALGEAAAVGGNKVAVKADASSGSGATSFVGFVEAASVITKAGEIAAAQFETGLTLAFGDPVFMSKTPGAVTNDLSGFATGDVVLQVGKVNDDSAYGGTPANSKAGLSMEIGDPFEA